MANILIYSPDTEKTPYILEQAKRAQDNFGAEKIFALVAGENAAENAKAIANSGVDSVISVQTDNVFPETVSSIMKTLIEKYDINAVLMMNQALEIEIAGRLSTKIGASCLTNCLSLNKEAENVYLAEKMLYGGVVVGNYQLTGRTIVVTLNDNVCREKYTGNQQATIIEEAVEIKGLNKKKTGEQQIEQTVNLKNAKKIVSVGRGISKQEDISIVEGLADAIGAQLGCSRPIVEDFKWLKLERQVGLTGTIVAPDLYVAVGISGQIQHAVGIKDAKIIVAINNNKNAPIFEVADYGIVGDLYEVVPKLQEALKGVVAK